MSHDVDAIYDQGMFRPLQPLTLPDGARVRLHVEEHDNRAADSNSGDGELPTLLERLKEFVGTVHNLPPDASANLDHYLYGTPKRQ